MSNNTANNIESLERLVAKRQDWLFRFAYMRIGRREDAEDIVQEVFLSVYRKMLEKGEIEDVEHYLTRSVSNACRDYFRRKRQTIVSLESLHDVQTDDDDKDIHEEFLRIKRLLDDLSEEQSETLRLRCYDGLTFKEIAELHEVTESTVKSRYRYAIQHIQKKLSTNNK